MIGCGNENGVDVFFVQQFAVIDMSACEIVRTIADLVASRLVYVAAGDQIESPANIGRVQITAHAASAAYRSQAYGVVRACGSRGGQRAHAAGRRKLLRLGFIVLTLVSYLKYAMRRRDFLRQSVSVPVAALFAKAAEIQCDIAVIGGSVGGCAAALAAARNGMRVVLTESTDWLGGQLTSQAVPPDEHPWIEQFGCTASYRAYRNAVRDFYRAHYPLTEVARERVNLNPGNGGVSRLTHEPRVSLAVIEDMLAPYQSSGALTILLEHVPESATTAEIM